MPAQYQACEIPVEDLDWRYSSSTSTPRTYRTQMIPTAPARVYQRSEAI